jgi:hypothetical protein
MKRWMRSWVVTAACAVGVAGVALPLSAQSFLPRRDNRDVPDQDRPPAGMCRIWIEGVPADRQPAPTDCSSAIRNKPANARVIFGGDPKTPPPTRLDRGTDSHVPRIDTAAKPIVPETRRVPERVPDEPRVQPRQQQPQTQSPPPSPPPKIVPRVEPRSNPPKKPDGGSFMPFRRPAN